MSPEMIELIIKWGPLALVVVTFIACFVTGVIRGTYKVVRRLVYVVLYVVLVWIFIDQITGLVLDINIPIKNFGTVRGYVVDFIENNEKVNNFLSYSGELKSLIVDNPEIIISPILFLVLVLIILPISYPIYWIYLFIWWIFAKYVFKREKYQKDEEGNILRNEKGKKVKIVRKKRRIVGGLIRGVQGVVLICLSLLPVNFANRLYNRAKSSASLEDGETLCGSVGVAKVDEQICTYLDLYNRTIFAKLGGEKSLDKFVSDTLTTVKVNGEKVSLEKELSNTVVSFVYLNDSGLMDILMKGEINLDTLDLSTINFDKINLAIDSLFSSYAVSRLSEAGVKYVLNEVLNDKLVDLLKDDDIVSKLVYEDSSKIKEELKNIVNVIKFAVEKNIDNAIIDNKDDVVAIAKNVSASDIESLLNKILTLRIVSKAMPSALKAYGEKYGVNEIDEMSEELNADISKNLVNALKLVQTMEINSKEDLTEGNLVDNLTNALFENGALNTNSKDSLATLLHDLNSSYLFKDVISTVANDFIEKKDYKVDARVLRYVDSKESWLKELSVLEEAYSIYDEYKGEEKVNYNKVTDLLNSISQTKVMISVLPFAYDELLPKFGIEIDSDGLPVIEFDKENEDASKVEFYNTWENELLTLRNVANSLEVLQLQKLDDITIDLLDKEENLDALATVMGEVSSSNLLKEPFAEFMKDKINEFVKDFEVEFSKDELLSLDSKEKWENEFSNINNVLSVDFSNQENITGDNLEVVFNSVNNMSLFKTKKIDVLKYAVRKSEFLTVDEYNSINWPSDDQASIDAFYNTETGILVDIVDKRETIETLANDVDLKTLDTTEIGDLLNKAMDSSILNRIITNKVSDLFIKNDVRHDLDEVDSVDKLKASISEVDDWKKELSTIKDMLNISEETMDDVSEGKTIAEKVFESIEDSQLLVNTRANLLIKAVKIINISEIPSGVTAKVLSENNYQKYNYEKSVIIDVSNNKEMFDDFATMDLKSIDTVAVGGLLDEINDSIIFSDYVNKELVKVFTSSSVNIRDDRDYDSLLNTNLESSIRNVDSFKEELDVIKDMLNISESNFNEVNGGKTRVEKMFDDIENSDLLSNMRANILMKAISVLNIEGINTNYVNVGALMAEYNDEAYYQYNREVSVVETFAKNKTVINNLIDADLSNLDSGSKGVVATLLDSIKFSEIFKDKYIMLLDGDGSSDNKGALNAIRSNGDLASYGVSVKTRSETNDYRSISWANEINSLDTISNNISVLRGYNSSTIDKNSELSVINGIADTIGSTLDAIAGSDLIADGADQMIANKVIGQLTNNTVNSITKGESWQSSFKTAINIYVEALKLIS